VTWLPDLRAGMSVEVQFGEGWWPVNFSVL
jgi:hypothetical protein